MNSLNNDSSGSNEQQIMSASSGGDCRRSVGIVKHVCG